MPPPSPPLDKDDDCICNPPKTFAETNFSSRTFIEALSDQQEAGYGFIPFIGAGFSAQSGVPLINELTLYLQRCIGLALGLEEEGMRPWNPRTDQWPPYSERRRVPVEFWFDRIRNEHRHLQVENRWSLTVRIHQEAIGAMADWRTCLLFLSRLTRTGKELILEAPDPDVVDSFFRHLIDGKEPSLGHSALANIAPMLRIDLIVTTNFDDLLERSFATTQVPLRPFDVHLQSGLPPWSALATQRSIVKLHGSRHSLRADYSVDSLPSEVDLNTFLDYFLTNQGRAKRRNEDGPQIQQADLQNHLLIAGISATENRSKAFLRHLWENLPEQFHIFWLCHSVADIKNIKAFHKQLMSSPRPSKGCPQLHVLRHTNHGLFFLHAYQFLCRGLPSKHLLFPAASRLPVPPLRFDARAEPSENPPEQHAFQVAVEEIRAALEVVQKPDYEDSRLVVLTSGPDQPGLMSVAGQVFDEVQKAGQVSLWIDMNDVSSADDLFEQLIDAAYYRLGEDRWMPVFLEKDPRPRAGEMRRLTEATRDPWVIFLNARETPGANQQDDSQVQIDELDNGWLDAAGAPSGGSMSNEDTSRNTQAFIDLLVELCGRSSPHVSIVLLCRSKRKPARRAAKLVGTAAGDRDIDGPLLRALDLQNRVHNGRTIVRIVAPCTTAFPDVVVRKVLEWVASPKTVTEVVERGRFLHALVLLQRTRYLASIWEPAFGATDAKEDRSRRLEWLYTLEKDGFVRWKPGGFIWLHSHSRNKLRRIFAHSDKWPSRLKASNIPLLSSTHMKSLGAWKPENEAAPIHWGLAHWHQRVVLAAQSPQPVFEAMYHACRSANNLLRLDSPQPGATEEAAERIDWATSLLHAFGFLVQTSGHSRGSCRRLSYLRNEIADAIQNRVKDRGSETDPVVKAIRRLQIRCTEAMRNIAREVAEDRKAYFRHKEVRELLCGKKLVEGGPMSVGNKEFEESVLERAKQGDPSHLYEWLRWGRWSGMLAIASRSYHMAHRVLKKSLDAVIPSKFDDFSASAVFITACRKDEVKILDIPSSDSQRLRVEVARCLEEWAFLLLLWANVVEKVRFRRIVLTERISGRNPQGTTVLDQILSVLPPEVANGASGYEAALTPELVALIGGIPTSPPDYLTAPGRTERITEHVLADQEADGKMAGGWVEKARELVASGLMVVDQALAFDNSLDSYDKIPLMWVRSRLLMHQAIAVLRSSGDGGVSLAMKFLSDAEACLNVSDTRRDSTDLALIELYRAEVRLHEAERVIVRDPSWVDAGLTFREHCLELSNQLSTGVGARPDAIRLRDLYKDRLEPAFKEKLVKVQAITADAVRCLDRAGRVLRSRRRNVWWATWYFHRRLTAVAMSVWATVGEEGTPIPFLGLEAALRKSPTIADRMLEESLRMVRFDSYRLATIVDAYAENALALRMRLLLDWRAEPLPIRQKDMHDRLFEALVRLQEVQKRRFNPEGIQGTDWTKAEQDPHVLGYIQGVIALTNWRLKCLKHPLS